MAGMLYINEWFPNPVGPDAAGEFIELYNSGGASVVLDGYALGAGGKKKVSLSGYTIPPRGYLSLAHARIKMSLKNTDGEVLLYGPHGEGVDEARFAGVAPEGRSWSRVDYGTAPIGHFAWTYPTPGAANRTIDMGVTARRYPYGVSLAPRLGLGGVVLFAACVSAVLLALFLYVISKNKNISDLLLGGDETARI